MEALTRNVGTWIWMLREKFKQRSCENQSTNAIFRGRPVCSSDEVPVMGMERRGWLIQRINLNN
jgi:hypothetical protein